MTECPCEAFPSTSAERIDLRCAGTREAAPLNAQMSPIELKYVTLFGIGPYARPAQLSLRPLTILCGKNGSGKSTWFKAITALQESWHTAPFSLNLDTNAYIQDGSRSIEAVFDPDTEPKFGIPGTVGAGIRINRTIHFLESTATQPYPRSTPDLFLNHPFIDVLSSGVCPDNTDILLQFSDPRFGNNRYTRFRAVLNNNSEIQLRRYRPDSPFVLCLREPVDTTDWRYSRRLFAVGLVESSGLNTDFSVSSLTPESASVEDIGDFFDRSKIDIIEHLDEALLRQIVGRLCEWISFTLRLLASTTFSISSTRDPLSHGVPDGQVHPGGLVTNRHVGSRGEASLEILSVYSKGWMRPPSDPYLIYDSDDCAPPDPLTTVSFDEKSWDLLLWFNLGDHEPGRRQTLAELTRDLGPDQILPDERTLELIEHFWSLLPEHVRRLASDTLDSVIAYGAIDRGAEANRESLFSCNALILDNLMRAPRLFGPTLPWPTASAEMRWMIDTCRQDPQDRLKWRRNRLLIDATLNDVMPAALRPKIATVATFTSYWMDYLAEINQGKHADLLSEEEKNQLARCVIVPQATLPDELGVVTVETPANTGMTQRCPEHKLEELLRLAGDIESQDRSVVTPGKGSLDSRSKEPLFRSPYFGEPRERAIDDYLHREVGISRFSSGVHYLLPIVIQTAVMRQREICLIENPEVHLHPGLQLKVGEFLIKQAKAGKIIVAETHSDLILRRIMRGIMDEDIPQSGIGIYFVGSDWIYDDVSVDSETVKMRFKVSSLDEIKIDDSGQIANWPEGFLDDDIKESKEVLRRMYPELGLTFEDDDE